MSKASPAFQFYAQDFFVGTMQMSAAARGCFISMLAFSWVNGPIADTPKAIKLAMCWDQSDGPFETLWQEIAPKWMLSDGVWSNRRLESVRSIQRDYREKQASFGKLGGRPSGKGSHKGTLKGSQTSSSSVFDLRSSSFSVVQEQPPVEYDWFQECKTLHGNTCNGRVGHAQAMGLAKLRSKAQ